MEIKGTRKDILDDINKPVKLLGLESRTLLIVFSLFFVVLMIMYSISLIAVLMYLVVFVFSMSAVARKFKESQKRGIENPLVDYYEELNSYRSIKMETTFIEELYEQREG